jgi:hypothetical protein
VQPDRESGRSRARTPGDRDGRPAAPPGDRRSGAPTACPLRPLPAWLPAGPPGRSTPPARRARGGGCASSRRRISSRRGCGSTWRDEDGSGGLHDSGRARAVDQERVLREGGRSLRPFGTPEGGWRQTRG